jgi:hypothetical protein
MTVENSFLRVPEAWVNLAKRVQKAIFNLPKAKGMAQTL